MAKAWKTLRDGLSPEVQARASARTEALLVEVELAELRRARGMTQTQVAHRLEIEQGAVSRLERRGDLYLSTLQDYIQALGGELRLVASFPDADIPLSRLDGSR